MSGEQQPTESGLDLSLPAPDLLRQIIFHGPAAGTGERSAEVPVASLEAVLEQREALLGAVTYVLCRSQVDERLAHYLGPHTEAWERLVRAEALSIGAEHRAHRIERMRARPRRSADV